MGEEDKVAAGLLVADLVGAIKSLPPFDHDLGVKNLKQPGLALSGTSTA